MLTTPKKTKEMIVRIIKQKLVPMVHGDPGIGKSAVIQEIAEQFKLVLIDIRLSQCETVDLNGFPVFVDGVAKYVPMNIFPIASTPVPKDKTGFLLFLDEFNSAALSVQSASYKLILDRCVGQYKLHDKAVIVAAGNLGSNKAIVNRLSTPMQSRLIHIEMGIDINDWIDWAAQSKLDYRILSYLQGRPDQLHNFDPNHQDKTFASPRTWHFLSKLIQNEKNLSSLLPLIAGTISEAVAREFVLFVETMTKLPTISEILNNPKNALLDDDPAMLYAVSHLIATHASNANLPILIKYINRMPFEFETITLQNILRRNKALLKEDTIRDWMSQKAMELT
jgi:MoxR-like ATPase